LLLDGIVQKHVAKLLGVFFSDELGVEDHVNFVLTVLTMLINTKNTIITYSSVVWL